MDDTYSAKQIAHRLGIDPRVFRKFLRSRASPYEAVGRGGRYEFPKSDLDYLRDLVEKWQTKRHRSS